MKKIKFLFKKIRNMQWNQLWFTAKKISKKTKRFTILICFDMFFCGLIYGAGYMDYFEFEFYLLNRKERNTFLTSALNNKIIAKYNDKNYFDVFSNKILFNEKFNSFINRKFIDIEHSSYEKFLEFIKSNKSFIAKIVDSCGGKGIEIFYTKNYDNLKTLFNKLIKNKQFLLEELIVQDDTMNQLYDGSINSLRIISFIKDDGNIEILNIILRIGNGGIVDNFSSGGMYTFVSNVGEVMLPGIDEKGNIFDEHPISKTKIVGFIIPKFDEIITYVKTLAKVEEHVRYVGWDIAVTKEGLDVIEGNEYSGVFQMKPSLSKKKTGLLPIYRKFMDI